MKKIGLQLQDLIYKKLDKVAFLTGRTKTYYINNALDEYLDKIIESENLKEKVDFLLEEDNNKK